MLFLSIITDIIITIILVFSLSLANRSRKLINEYKYRLYSPYSKFLAVAIAFLSFGLYELITGYLATGSITALLDAYANIGLIILLLFYVSSKSYICDSGLWAWGALRKWAVVQSFRFSEDGRSIIFQVNENSFLSKYRSRFHIEKEKKQEITAYLKVNIKKKKL